MGSALGIVIALVALIVSVFLEGGSPAAFLNLPAIVIIFGGTFGATMASFSPGEFRRVPQLMGVSLRARRSSVAERREQLIYFAERARREGLLALDAEVGSVGDPFLRRGLQMVIDGMSPETVEEVLELDIESMQERHGRNIAMFSAMGGYAPTMGIIGTVMGLVNVLSHLEDPAGLGESIAVAFIATLLGVMTANVVWLPIASNLKQKDAAEAAERRMAVVAILAIQAGDNPRIVAQKLDSLAGPAAAPKPATEEAVAAGATADAAS